MAPLGSARPAARTAAPRAAAACGRPPHRLPAEGGALMRRRTAVSASTAPLVTAARASAPTIASTAALATARACTAGASATLAGMASTARTPRGSSTGPPPPPPLSPPSLPSRSTSLAEAHAPAAATQALGSLHRPDAIRRRDDPRAAERAAGHAAAALASAPPIRLRLPDAGVGQPRRRGVDVEAVGQGRRPRLRPGAQPAHLLCPVPLRRPPAAR